MFASKMPTRQPWIGSTRYLAGPSLARRRRRLSPAGLLHGGGKGHDGGGGGGSLYMVYRPQVSQEAS